MDTAMTGMNTHVLKEPLGFMRILQVPMAILAFATVAGYSADFKIPYSCAAGQQSESSPYNWGYPFSLTEVRVAKDLCNNVGLVVPFSYGAVSQSQFFVCTGVLSFLYALGILVLYLVSWNNYTSDPRRPMADFLVTGVLALFWFIGSCAWASGLSMVKTVTDPESMGNQLRGRHGSIPCKTADPALNMCTPKQTWNYGSLNISVIAGFACVGLWAANLWFIYKETIWYKNRMAAKATGGAPVQGGGPGGVGQTTMTTGPGALPSAGSFQY